MLYEFINPTRLINTDWSRVQSISSKMFSKLENGDFDKDKKLREEYGAVEYNLGNYGSLFLDTENEDGLPWYHWTGPLLTSNISWGKQIEEKLKNSPINFSNFTYFIHQRKVFEHTDGKTDEEKSFDGHCNLNFVISCEDPTSYTFIGRGSEQKTYPSNGDSAWLIDTTIPHGINNHGKREVFQMKFYNSFDRVVNYLLDNPDILWSN